MDCILVQNNTFAKRSVAENYLYLSVQWIRDGHSFVFLRFMTGLGNFGHLRLWTYRVHGATLETRPGDYSFWQALTCLQDVQKWAVSLPSVPHRTTKRWSGFHTGGPSSSCEMIISRNNGHGGIIRVCMGIFTTALRNKIICQILKKNTSPYFHSVSLVTWPLTLMKRAHFSKLFISRFSTYIRKALRIWIPPGPNLQADMDPSSQIWTPFQTFLLSILCIIFGN